MKQNRGAYICQRLMQKSDFFCLGWKAGCKERKIDPYFTGENSERLSNLPKLSQLANGRSREFEITDPFCGSEES